MSPTIPPEIELERFLQEKHSRGERRYAHITNRLAIEDLAEDHPYRWLVTWMNLQLSDIGPNSSGQTLLPPLHFDIVQVTNGVAAAHVFEADNFTFIVATQPMIDQMLELSERFVFENSYLVFDILRSSSSLREISQLLWFMQFCLVCTHEYSHLVRQHGEDDQELRAEMGGVLSQVQELDADGFGIYHVLPYFVTGGGKQFVDNWLRLSDDVDPVQSVISCFLMSIMIQFCTRWAGKITLDADARAEHPPVPIRIKYSTLFVEMWCKYVAHIPATWMTDGTLKRYFSAAANLFDAQMKATWDAQIALLNSLESDKYLAQLEAGVDRIRKGRRADARSR